MRVSPSVREWLHSSQECVIKSAPFSTLTTQFIFPQEKGLKVQYPGPIHNLVSSLLEQDTLHWTVGHTPLRSHVTPAPTLLPSLRGECVSLCLSVLNKCTTLLHYNAFEPNVQLVPQEPSHFRLIPKYRLHNCSLKKKKKLHTPTDSEKTSPPHPTRGLLRLYTKNSTVNFLQATDHSFKASAPHPNPTMQNHHRFSI